MSALTELRKQAGSCTACELYAGATQTVFGAGRLGASIVLAGEQPGTRRIATCALRASDERQDEMFDGLVADLELAARSAGWPSKSG